MTSTCRSNAHQEWDCPRHYWWRKQFTRDRWCEPCRTKTADAVARGFYSKAERKVGA